MSRKRHNYNVHHKIGQCCRSRAYVEEECNKMLLDTLQHDGLNHLFNTKQNPQDQLCHMVGTIWNGVLAPEVEKQLRDIINLPREKFYRKDIIRGTH